MQCGIFAIEAENANPQNMDRKWYQSKGFVFNPISPGGKPRANAYTRENQWAEILKIFVYS